MTGEMSDQNVALCVGENAEKILALTQAGFFDFKSGSFTVHVDQDGKLRKIEKHYVYNLPTRS